MNDPKVFRHAFRIAYADLKASKRLFDDKRMTPQEKKLLRAVLSLRDFKNEEIISELEFMTFSHPLVESVRLFCLGTAHNNKTEFQEAIGILRTSLELNNTFEGRFIKKMTLQNLFLAYYNLRNASGMASVLKEFEALGKKYEDDELCFKCMKFTYLVFIQDHAETHREKPKMEMLLPSMSEVQTMNYFIDLLESAVAQENLTEANKALERMKNIRKFKNAPMMLLLRGLMEKLLYNKNMYLYEKDFIAYPYLLAYVQCINALESGDCSSATAAWMKLREHHPKDFKEPFRYTGPKTLFSIYLDRIIPKSRTALSQPSGRTMEEKLFTLLSDGVPVSKEELHLALYGSPLSDKRDLVKLAKVVHRLKLQSECEVKTMKGSYVLLTGKKKKVS